MHKFNKDQSSSDCNHIFIKNKTILGLHVNKSKCGIKLFAILTTDVIQSLCRYILL